MADPAIVCLRGWLEAKAKESDERTDLDRWEPTYSQGKVDAYEAAAEYLEEFAKHEQGRADVSRREFEALNAANDKLKTTVAAVRKECEQVAGVGDPKGLMQGFAVHLLTHFLGGRKPNA